MGEYVWINPSQEGEFEVPMGARIISRDARRIKVVDDDGQEAWIGLSELLRPMHSTSLTDVEDMIVLGDLQEHAILRNLLLRYRKDVIYTYTGNMLVAVNPYKVLPIYTKKELTAYRNQKIGDKPPHIFAVGDNSYEKMRKEKFRQCVVISGESGAGKTESTKLILQYLAAISQKHSWIEQQILDSNPVMEAFGNARTLRNDNSSRFGKYIALRFGSDGAIIGAEIQQYLLEKSRLVSQNNGERNYHIFYSMLAGLTKDEKAKLDLTEANNYRYLTGGNTLTCEGRDEASEFADIKSALKVLNFSEAETWNIFQLLATILHLGNLQFKPVSIGNMEGSEIIDLKLVDRIASALGTNPQALVSCLTKKILTTQGDSVTTNLSKDQAMETKDAFVKALYGNLFIYIVDKINKVIKPQQAVTDQYIGVLDIFGFENFESNSFEQLCINLANESLQQFFILHIFKLEQEQYTNEGVDWKHIQFVDNQAILDMIAVKPMNILALIDEEAKFPKGTDETMLAKIVAEHEQKKEFFRPKYKGISAFGIYHFAGAVFYNVKDFLEKDRDSFSADLRHLAETSPNKFLKSLFPVDNSVTHAKKKDTLALKFRQSLDQLLGELRQCNPFFVRCIKPNELKKPNIFDRTLCCRQLRYSGMMETAKIRQAGFPIRYTFQEFVERFRVLGHNVPPAHKADCKAATASICERMLGNKGEYSLGYTKVFLKTADDIRLDNERQIALSKYILVLQKNIRGWICRRRYQRLKKAAIVMQSHWRGRKPRKEYLKRIKGYRRLQAVLRSRVLTHRFKIIRKKISALQAYCKGFVVRQWVQQKVHEKKKNLQELMALRRKEEEDFRRAGKKDWRELAATNWRQRLTALNISIYEDDTPTNQEAFDEDDEEEQKKLVDNVFGFLDNDKSLSGGKSTSILEELGIGRGRSEDYLELLDADPDTEDYSQFNFRKYAATYFRGNENSHFYRRPLRHALLDSTPGGLDPAARALWITTLRFMGDLPEPRYAEPIQNQAPVMAQISQTLSRKFAQSAAFRDAVASEEDRMSRRKLISMTLKKSSKISANIRQAIMEEGAEEAYIPWLNSRSTNLDKIHFIIGHGILKPELRDEIFSQVCKQLTNNPSKASFARGWVLLSLCVGCFAPSDKLLNPLRSFIQSGPQGYAQFCLNRLKRTAKNGARTQPPSWLELQAIKYKKPIDVPVTLMDGTTKIIQVDSAMTAQELVESLSNSINLKDSYGFAVFITLYEKVSSLGGGKEHVLDAVSQCEQYAREQGQTERAAHWRMYLRKEMFAPWHDASSDPAATNLIYFQVVRGLKSGEYRCEKESDLALLISQQYYCDYGLLDKRKLPSILPGLIPDHISKTLDQDKMARWMKVVEDSYNKNLQSRPTIERLKEDIVNFAKTKWPLMFSKFYEVVETTGNTPLPKTPLVAAVNWTGVYFVDQNEQVLLQLPFMEMSGISIRENQMGANIVKLLTIEGIEMSLQGPNVSELNDVLNELHSQLKKRSKFVVVTKEYRPTEDSSFMGLMKGDLIILSDLLTGESLEFNSFGEGKNERTGDTGYFPVDNVSVIPSAVHPTPTVLALLKEGPVVAQRGPGIGTIQRMKLYTLEKYAAQHFRLAARRSTISRGTSMTSVKENVTEETWRHSREPLRRPLLRRLQDDDTLGALACAASLAMLKYMGDQPTRRLRVATEYTDKIFEPALKYEPLRDEIYCQLMKQLTVNRNRISEERGWELLWLLTGSFTCSAELERELTKFLQARRMSSIAQDCLLRFQRTLASGSRKYPPHLVEVEAIQHKHKQIYHRVYFPDDSDEAFEVESTTRTRDIVAAIAKRLDLKSCDGFSLFIKVLNKVLSIPENDYFFDYVRLLLDWIKRNMPGSGDSSQQHQYQIFFMRKLWSPSVAGRDKRADVIFHFPQEVPKYLRGYHKVSKQEVIEIASLLYVIKFGNSKVDTQAIQVLQQLIPQDMVKLQKPKDWQKAITTALGTNKNLTADDAKVEFLRAVQQWPTFGSAFFEVKQTTEPNYPDLVIVAVNRRGVLVINPATKDILATHEYTQISNWSSGNTYFTMNIGTMLRGGGIRLLMETTLGYKMDDLIASYADLLHSTTARRKSVKARAPLPPS